MVQLIREKELEGKAQQAVEMETKLANERKDLSEKEKQLNSDKAKFAQEKNAFQQEQKEKEQVKEKEEMDKKQEDASDVGKDLELLEAVRVDLERRKVTHFVFFEILKF